MILQKSKKKKGEGLPARVGGMEKGENSIDNNT